mmetsp:Transcript_8291/g.14856  ORF Transcript_8291/g.14856 Transcript_8291/m.14856 type:complete len:302 (+) Transcript_8291:62-967(+)
MVGTVRKAFVAICTWITLACAVRPASIDEEMRSSLQGNEVHHLSGNSSADLRPGRSELEVQHEGQQQLLAVRDRADAPEPADIKNCMARAKGLFDRCVSVQEEEVWFEQTLRWKSVSEASSFLVKYNFKYFSTIAAFADAVRRVWEAVQWMQQQLATLKHRDILELQTPLVKGMFGGLFNTRARGRGTGELTNAIRKIGSNVQTFVNKCYSKERYAKKFTDYYKQKGGTPTPLSCLGELYPNPAALANAVLALVHSFKKDLWEALQKACVPEGQRSDEPLTLLQAALESVPQTITVPASFS